MEEKKVSVKELKIKVWLNEQKEKAKKTVKSAVDFVVENPVATAAICGLATSGFRTIRKGVIEHNAEVKRQRTFYDPRKGRYSEARRNLKGYEIDEIDARYDAGESYNHILRDMDLLK